MQKENLENLLGISASRLSHPAVLRSRRKPENQPSMAASRPSFEEVMRRRGLACSRLEGA
jgi:hypothetical protein